MMTREEAIKIIDCYDIGFYDLSGEKIPADKLAEAFDMAIEALSTDTVQGVGRYENAMQKLRDMPRYLNGVKEKQITKISANYITESPNDIVEQKNDTVAEPTDLISRAELLDRIKAINSIPWGDDHGNAVKLVWSTEEVKRLIEKAPSADRPSGEWIPCSERMPEDGQGVIICTDDNRFKDHPVGTCIYEDGRFHTNYRYDISMLAWMPLPEPYCEAKNGSDAR